MRNSIRAALCAVLVGLLAGCGGGGGGSGGGGFLPMASVPSGATTPETPTVTPPTSPPVADPNAPPPATTAMLRGTVTTGTAKTAVAGVTVRIAGGQTTTTAADGFYSVTISGSAQPTTVMFTKSGYQTMAKQAGIFAGVTTVQDITLYTDDVRTTFPATVGKTLVVNGAVIEIPANAIKDATGNPYIGEVSIAASYNNPTTARGNDAFPQPYAGLDGSTEVTLQSLGVLEARLYDAAGDPLQLSLPATLMYPRVDAISNAAVIPLWYYDKTRMNWVREGQATRQADGSYAGTVTHFTQWNLDVAFGNGYSDASITACVQFAGGEAARGGISMVLSSFGMARTVQIQPLAAGTISFLRVPVGVNQTLSFLDAGSGNTVVQQIAPLANGAMATLPCVVLVGTPVPVPPPPPPPPEPTPADTAPSAFAGTYPIGFGGDPAPVFGNFSITVSATGAITGSGTAFVDDGVSVTPSPLTLTGQVAAGGFLTMVGTGLPAGPLNFAGRFPTLSSLPGGSWELNAVPASFTATPTRQFYGNVPT